MKILDRYIVRGFLQCFFLVLPSLVGIYLLVDLFEKIDEFIEQKVPVVDTFAFFLLRLPQIAFDLFPVSVLFAGIIFFSIIIKNREYVALEAVGIPPARIIRPPLITGALMALALLVFHAWVVGPSNLAAKHIWDQEIEKVPSFGSSSGTNFFRGKGTIWSFRQAGGTGGLLFDVTLVIFDEDYELKTILRSKEAHYSKGRWHFSHGTVQHFKSGKVQAISPFSTMDLALPDNPETFSRFFTAPKDMGLVELAKTILELKEMGIYDREAESIFWNRLFYPLFGVALLYFGLRLLTLFQQGGLGLGMLIGLIVSFTGWAFWNLFCSWGETGYISPVLPPIIILSTFLIISHIISSKWRIIPWR